MKPKTWVLICMHLGMWSVVIWMLFLYATDSKKSAFLTIQASYENFLAQSVFAQFIYTQTLHISRPIFATEILLPLLIPEHPQPLTISLYQRGDTPQLLHRWRYPNKYPSIGIVQAQLPFTVPLEIQGDLELVLSGRQIAHTDKMFAPGVFIEREDHAYPNGNYRIANNEKEGDISLEIIEQKTNYEAFMEQIRQNSISELPRLLLFCAFALLLFQLPTTAVRLFQSMTSIVHPAEEGEEW